MLAALVLCLAGPGDLAKPIDLYAMTLEEARTLHGFRVEVFLEAGCPCDVGDGYTMVGGYEKPDGVSRATRLRGEYHDIDPGRVGPSAARTSPGHLGFNSLPRRSTRGFRIRAYRLRPSGSLRVRAPAAPLRVPVPARWFLVSGR